MPVDSGGKGSNGSPFGNRDSPGTHRRWSLPALAARIRSPPIPEPDRLIHVPTSTETSEASAFCPNSVYTTRYTALSFLPKFLYLQFRKAPNMFFLVIAVLQQIPGCSPTSRFSTILPLAFILVVSAVKELLEDQV